MRKPLHTQLAIVISTILLVSCVPGTVSIPNGGNDDIHDIRVQVVEPIRTTAKVEQFPLPNCGGTDKLAQSLGTYASVSKSATVGATATTTGGAEVAIPETAKLKLEIQVELAYQSTFESANSRIDSIVMSAAAGTHVIYTILWEEQGFNSIIKYSADGKVYEAPYAYQLRVPKIDTSYNIICPTPIVGNGSVGPTQSPITATQPSSSTSAGKCPSTAEKAASIFGGSVAYWKPLAGFEQNAWKYGPAPAEPIENINIPEGMKGDWWDNFKAHSQSGPARGGYATEATIWCVP